MYQITSIVDLTWSTPFCFSSVKSNELLRKEWERIQAEEAFPTMDTSRYSLDPPKGGSRADPSEWNSAVENAAAQLQHQSVRYVPLLV